MKNFFPGQVKELSGINPSNKSPEAAGVHQPLYLSPISYQSQPEKYLAVLPKNWIKTKKQGNKAKTASWLLLDAPAAHWAW